MLTMQNEFSFGVYTTGKEREPNLLLLLEKPEPMTTPPSLTMGSMLYCSIKSSYFFNAELLNVAELLCTY